MMTEAIGWIVFGLVAGYLANTLAIRRGEGLVFDMSLGAWGALIGGWIFNLRADPSVAGFRSSSLAIAAAGAIVTLSGWYAIRRSASRISTSRRRGEGSA